MPELPEVEVIRQSLAPLVGGRAIVGVRFGAFTGVVGDDAPEAVRARLLGQRFAGIRRRGKYLLFDLEDGTVLLVHLRMTGHLRITDRNEPPLRFEHLAIELDDGHDLRFADQRKFGRVQHVPPAAMSALEARLGPEPLTPEFSARVLGERLAHRTGKVKSVLLDQKVVAGLGNIYVDEALFQARIHPERLANSLSDHEIRALHRAIRATLRDGLGHRGTSFSSFADGHGEKGQNQHYLRVYGRVDQPCPRCGQPLRKIIVGGRGTHYCPHCQPLAPTFSGLPPPPRHSEESRNPRAKRSPAQLADVSNGTY